MVYVTIPLVVALIREVYAVPAVDVDIVACHNVIV